ncbi:type I phosphomannose isomerase catalytic subunit [Mesoplasma photuris]|uniref:type I phosphomannose isomerase catalytic subunit n=1 Tax=Mesoplasma photuris TaxID=217731 RepID=UPI0004E204CB|nr:type I phosphomannose isomerase catalytic subunit [Mesoplasma photuris]
MEIIKLKPAYSEKLWGGSKLKELGFDIPNGKKIGEAWTISAHENGMSYLSEGKFAGLSLKEVFDNHRESFGNYTGMYPMLTKIITANDYLSVQVHPDDEYALKKHNELGKPESWYILDCPENAQLIYGHNAKSKDELSTMIENGQWDKLLKNVDIKKGDFLFVDAGKIHAITPGVTVIELQRSSDVTYRLYDYDRLEADGKPRRLDLEDSINCTTVPDSDDVIVRNANKEVFNSDFFSIYILDATIENTFKISESASWLQLSVVDGSGTINGIDFKTGESAITMNGIEDIKVTGNLKVYISWIRK